MIPPLDARGLLPPGIHPATLDEIDRLADNARRRWLADGLRRFVERELTPWAKGLVLDVGGSYFSDKAAPDDIEATLRVPLGRAAELAARLCAIGDTAGHLRIWREYRLDFYVTIEGLGNDFSAFFQYVGPKAAAIKHLMPRDPRGIVRLTL